MNVESVLDEAFVITAQELGVLIHRSAEDTGDRTRIEPRPRPYNQRHYKGGDTEKDPH